jgi:hypothetical protein
MRVCHSATPAKPRRGERWDSNPRPPGPQPGALPLSYVHQDQPLPVRRTNLPHTDIDGPNSAVPDLSAPGRIRTCDPRIRSPLLYPAELQAHIPTSRRDIRRHESGRRDSNPRHSAWKADALPTELHPPARACSHPNQWSGREDLNLRPPAPKAGALPGCATSRQPHVSGFGRESIAY